MEGQHQYGGVAMTERRRGRRVNLEVPLSVRRVESGQALSVAHELTKNLNLAGVYFETEHPESYASDGMFVVSASIPKELTGEFPFTLVEGLGRVVRMIPLAGANEGQQALAGVALELGEDVTALAAMSRE